MRCAPAAGCLAVMIASASAVAGCGKDPPPTSQHGSAAGSASAPVAPAPRAGTPELAAILEPIRARHDLPALGAGLWQNGKQLALAVTGWRRAGDAAHPVALGDQWHLGSDTKAMTATLIAIYVDRGALHWDDTLAKLFPGDKLDPALAAVTLDQLLQHRAGFATSPPLALWAQLRKAGAAPTARADFVRELLALPPAAKIGTFTYSNSSFVVAGAALERATGKRWEDMMRADLFAPLGMDSCGFGPPGTTAAVVDQPWGHEQDGTPIAPDAAGADNPPGLGPAATVHCSLADWGKFLSLHAEAPQTLVSPAALAHLHTPPAGGNYMGGWGFAQGLLAHDGSNTKWYCSALINPKSHVVMAWVTNRAGTSAAQPSPVPSSEILAQLGVYGRSLVATDGSGGSGGSSGSAR